MKMCSGAKDYKSEGGLQNLLSFVTALCTRLSDVRNLEVKKVLSLKSLKGLSII